MASLILKVTISDVIVTPLPVIITKSNINEIENLLPSKLIKPIFSNSKAIITGSFGILKFESPHSQIPNFIDEKTKIKWPSWTTSLEYCTEYPHMLNRRFLILRYCKENAVGARTIQGISSLDIKTISNGPNVYKKMTLFDPANNNQPTGEISFNINVVQLCDNISIGLLHTSLEELQLDSLFTASSSPPSPLEMPLPRYNDEMENKNINSQDTVKGKIEEEEQTKSQAFVNNKSFKLQIEYEDPSHRQYQQFILKKDIIEIPELQLKLTKQRTIVDLRMARLQLKVIFINDLQEEMDIAICIIPVMFNYNSLRPQTEIREPFHFHKMVRVLSDIEDQDAVPHITTGLIISNGPSFSQMKNGVYEYKEVIQGQYYVGFPRCQMESIEFLTNQHEMYVSNIIDNISFIMSHKKLLKHWRIDELYYKNVFNKEKMFGDRIRKLF